MKFNRLRVVDRLLVLIVKFDRLREVTGKFLATGGYG